MKHVCLLFILTIINYASCALVSEDSTVLLLRRTPGPKKPPQKSSGSGNPRNPRRVRTRGAGQPASSQLSRASSVGSSGSNREPQAAGAAGVGGAARRGGDQAASRGAAQSLGSARSGAPGNRQDNERQSPSWAELNAQIRAFNNERDGGGPSHGRAAEPARGLGASQQPPAWGNSFPQLRSQGSQVQHGHRRMIDGNPSMAPPSLSRPPSTQSPPGGLPGLPSSLLRGPSFPEVRMPTGAFMDRVLSSHRSGQQQQGIGSPPHVANPFGLGQSQGQLPGENRFRQQAGIRPPSEMANAGVSNSRANLAAQRHGYPAPDHWMDRPDMHAIRNYLLGPTGPPATQAQQGRQFVPSPEAAQAVARQRELAGLQGAPSALIHAQREANFWRSQIDMQNSARGPGGAPPAQRIRPEPEAQSDSSGDRKPSKRPRKE